jgi:hypothetical protein
MNATFILRDRAAPWYGIVPFETGYDGSAFPVGEIYDQFNPGMSLLGLLQGITNHAHSLGTPERVLVVGHAAPTGLAIPLVPQVERRDRRADQLYLGMLSGRNTIAGVPIGQAALLEEETGSQAPSDQQLAELLHPITLAQITALRQAMRDVQSLRIPYLDFRACNIGGSEPTLRQIGHFFGAQFVCAPAEPDGFGDCVVDIVPSSQELSSRVRGCTPYPSRDEALVWMRLSNLTLSAFAQRRADVARWINETFAAGGVFQASDPLIDRALGAGIPIHGFASDQIAGSVPLAQEYGTGWFLPGTPVYQQVLRQVIMQ